MFYNKNILSLENISDMIYSGVTRLGIEQRTSRSPDRRSRFVTEWDEKMDEHKQRHLRREISQQDEENNIKPREKKLGYESYKFKFLSVRSFYDQDKKLNCQRAHKLFECNTSFPE